VGDVGVRGRDPIFPSAVTPDPPVVKEFVDAGRAAEQGERVYSDLGRALISACNSLVQKQVSIIMYIIMSCVSIIMSCVSVLMCGSDMVRCQLLQYQY
jgi:hypothetical protein